MGLVGASRKSHCLVIIIIIIMWEKHRLVKSFGPGWVFRVVFQEQLA